MTILKKPFTLAIAAVLGLSVFASSANAQGFLRIFGQDVSPKKTTAAFPDMKKNVYAIDNLADQMTYLFKQEMKSHKGCSDCEALYNQMRRHTGLTNDLIKAYKGKDARKFHQVASDVRRSVSDLQRLQVRAKVSASVRGMISQSVPMAAYVDSKARDFRPIEIASR